MSKVWTKDAEREQLRKIEALIEETEPGSYIRMSFSGILEMAERNIDEDSANNMPDAIAFREKQIAEQDKQIADLKQRLIDANAEGGKLVKSLEYERDTLDAQLTGLRETYMNEHLLKVQAENQVSEMRRDADGTNALIADMRNEIIQLKAELYDYMRKECGK